MAVGTIKNPNAVKAITLTPVVNLTSLEYDVKRVGNLVTGFIAAKNNTGASLSDTASLLSGFPSPSVGIQHIGMTIGGADDRKALRFIVRTNGNLSLWYGGSLPSAASFSVHISYFCQ